MAKVFLISSSSATYSLNATVYNGILRSNFISTENDRKVRFNSAGVLSGLYCRVITNTKAVTNTYRTRIAGANGNQSVSIGAGATGEFEDTTNTDSISTNTDVNFQMTSSSGSNSLVIHTSRVLFASSSNTYSFGNSIITAGLNFSTASSTSYYPIIGNSINATEANASQKINTAGILKHLYVYIESNSRTTTTTFGTRIAGANGNLVISVLSGASGVFQDTSNTDSVTAGQKCNFYRTTGTGTQTTAIQTLTVGFETTNSKFFTGRNISAGTTVTTGVTTYWGSGSSEVNSTESNIAGNIGIDCTLSKLWLYISANAATGTSTHNVRKNGSSTAVTISIGAGTTGEFEDTTNTVDFTSTDELSFRFVNGGGGSITIFGGTLLVENTEPSSSFIPTPMLFMMAQSGGIM